MKTAIELRALASASGGPAFPFQVEVRKGDNFEGSPADENVRQLMPGMTLRDYFAGAALPALLKQAFEDTEDPLSVGLANVARWAYMAADAMLAERAK